MLSVPPPRVSSTLARARGRSNGRTIQRRNKVERDADFPLPLFAQWPPFFAVHERQSRGGISFSRRRRFRHYIRCSLKPPPAVPFVFARQTRDESPVKNVPAFRKYRFPTEIFGNTADGTSRNPSTGRGLSKPVYNNVAVGPRARRRPRDFVVVRARRIIITRTKNVSFSETNFRNSSSVREPSSISRRRTYKFVIVFRGFIFSRLISIYTYLRHSC